MRKTGHTSKSRATLAAILLVVLQSFLAAFTLGASAAPLDLYGNPLCLPAGRNGDAGHIPRHPDGLPPCCSPACPMVSALSGPAPEAATLPEPPLPVRVVSAVRPRLGSLQPDDEHRPGSQRAPPPRM